ncbi:hypothetical protein Cgig2_017733 [Carnegiea gigantea]|uniref:Uncharacterized protein n=1 Tax=Carnegiea gigantea TaxID=171969 RepID=A0A9Q1JP77_9CARY|nr:hypothetical protein Cgig2_017733 [Carnegiea gigantea]
MVDPNEGSSLNFIPATVVNGVKHANITHKDVTPEIGYWQMAVICSVLSSIPSLDVIEGFLRRIWQSYSIDKINLGLDRLSKLGSTLGIPIKTDRYTKEKRMVKYARLLIDMALDAPCSNFINFINDQEVVIRVLVSCEWKLVKCIHCKMFGHLESDYREKNKTKLVWKPVQHKELAQTIPTQAEKAEGISQQAALCSIAEHMDVPWCVLGDFNSALYLGDRIGGNDIQDFEIKPFADCINTYELQELRYLGLYFT